MLEGTKDAIINVGGKTIRLGSGFGGTVKAEIKNFEGALVRIMGSNKAQGTYQEKANVQISVTVNSMPADVLAEITGAPKTANGNIYTNNIQNIPDVGLVVSALRFGTDKDRVYVFPRCNATYTTVSMSTDTESKKTMATIQLDFTALDSDKLNATGGFMDVPSDDLSDAFKFLGWTDPADDKDGDFDPSKVKTQGATSDPGTNN